MLTKESRSDRLVPSLATALEKRVTLKELRKEFLSAADHSFASEGGLFLQACFYFEHSYILEALSMYLENLCSIFGVGLLMKYLSANKF